MKLLGLSTGSNWYKYHKLREERKLLRGKLKDRMKQEEYRMLITFCHNIYQWITKECMERQKKKFERDTSGGNDKHNVHHKR